LLHKTQKGKKFGVMSLEFGKLIKIRDLFPLVLTPNRDK